MTTLEHVVADTERFATNVSGGEEPMSVHDELVHARHTLDDLVRTVDRLQIRLGDGLDVRRLRADADHLRDDLDLLRQSTAAEESAQGLKPEVVFIPRTPYDPAMWAGCEDEGIGSRHGPERRQAHPAHRLSRRAQRTLARSR